MSLKEIERAEKNLQEAEDEVLKIIGHVVSPAVARLIDAARRLGELTAEENRVYPHWPEV